MIEKVNSTSHAEFDTESTVRVRQCTHTKGMK